MDKFVNLLQKVALFDNGICYDVAEGGTDGETKCPKKSEH